jgi:spermidine synthase
MVRRFRVDEIIWEGNTAIQHVAIGRTSQGIALFCDNERQSTELNQLVYHESLAIPAFLLADRIDSVLVVGSSEGVAPEMAIAAGAVRVDHVDIDEQAVRLCAEYLPYGYTLDTLTHAEKGIGPIRLSYADGWSFVTEAARTGARYDVVLVDLPEERPDTGAQQNRLYGTEFLRMCGSILNPGGVVAGQGGCPSLGRNGALLRNWQRFTDAFETTIYYGSDEQEWAFLFGLLRAVRDPVELLIQRLPALSYRPRSIDSEAIRGCSVPPYSVRHL